MILSIGPEHPNQGSERTADGGDGDGDGNDVEVDGVDDDTLVFFLLEYRNWR